MNEEKIIKVIENLIQENKELKEKYSKKLIELQKEREKSKHLLDEGIVTYFDDDELKESIGNYLGVLLKKNIEKDYISKDKIRELKELYIKDYKNRNITLIPLENLIKNINILLEEE